MSSSTALWYEWLKLRLPRLTKTLNRIGHFIVVLFGIGAYAEPFQPPAMLIAKTQEVWSKRLGREVPETEARMIIHEFSNFLSLLHEIRHNGKR